MKKWQVIGLIKNSIKIAQKLQEKQSFYVSDDEFMQINPVDKEKAGKCIGIIYGYELDDKNSLNVLAEDFNRHSPVHLSKVLFKDYPPMEEYDHLR